MGSNDDGTGPGNELSHAFGFHLRHTDNDLRKLRLSNEDAQNRNMRACTGVAYPCFIVPIPFARP